MATLDWSGLVFYDQQIKKYIENKLVDAGISKDELDKILDKYASKTYVSDEIAKATTGIDLTGYAKTSDVDVKLNNYIKKTDAFSGSYNDLTDKPNIPNVSNLAKKTEVTTHTDDTSIHVTAAEKSKWNAKAELSDIPSLTNYATKTFVTDEIAKASTSGVDLTGYAKTSDVDAKLNNYVKKNDAFSGSYNDLADKPIIPNVTGKADKTYVDTELAKKANKSELFSGSYNDLADKPNIPNVSNLATKTELNNHISSTKHITDDERTKWNGYNDTINTMKTNFEDGVNTIYNAVVAKGVTPLDKSPSNVAKAIESLVIKEKGQLLLTCKSSSSDKLPAPKFNNDNSYNYTCEDTDNGDGTYTRSIYGVKEINKISFNEDENKDWLISLECIANVKIVSAESMFALCSNLESVNLNNINTSECRNFRNMFAGCESLTSLNLHNFDTLNAYDMSYIFNGCSSLTSLDLSNFNTSYISDMRFAFYNCTSLASLDIRNFSSASLTYCSTMFKNVPSACAIYVDKTKFTKTEAECGFTGRFIDVSQQG